MGRRGDSTARFGYGARMSSLLRMLIAMAAILSLAMGLVAHAAEPTMAAETVCVETGHAEPAETAPGEGPEQHGLHAHGGCHGHHQVDAFGPTQWLADALCRGLSFAALHHFPAQSAPDPNLRPPIA